MIYVSVTHLEEEEEIIQKAALAETTRLLNTGDLGPFFKPLKPLTLTSVRNAYFWRKKSEKRKREEVAEATSLLSRSSKMNH